MAVLILWNKQTDSNNNYKDLKLREWLLQEMQTQFSQEHLTECLLWSNSAKRH